MDHKQKTIEREVKGILDIFGTVGGIQAILVAFVSSSYGVISEMAFTGSLARKFYLRRNRPDLTKHMR